MKFFLAIVLIFASIDLIYAQSSVKEADQLDFAQGLLSRGMYGMAITQYQKFIAEYPRSQSLPEAYLALGEGYFLSQDFKDAIETFNVFKQMFPNSERLPLSLLRLAQIDIRQKKYQEAVTELTFIDAQKQLKGPMLQAFDFYLGQAHEQQSDWNNALEFYQKAAHVDGAATYTADAWQEIGTIAAQTGKYDQALEAYSKAMQMTSDDELKDELTYKSAEAQFLAGKYNEAIKDFQQLADRSSNYTQDALANMLLAYYNLNQYDQLLSAYQKNASKISNDQRSFSVHLAAVMAYIELKQYDKANVLLDHMLAFTGLKPSQTAKIFIKKAHILIQNGKYKDALALLDAYSPQDPDEADEGLFLKAEGYYGLGDYDRAFNLFENVYLNFPTSRFTKAALLGQAHSRQRSGRLKESEALFLKYYQTQDDPGLKSDALFDAMSVADLSGDPKAAIAHAQEYLKTFPQNPAAIDVLLILANDEDKVSQPQEAVDVLQDYLGKTPAPPKPNSIYFLLGFNQELLGRNDEAVAAYGKVSPDAEGGKFYPGALKNIAIIYLNEKKEDEAKTYFDKLISQAGANDLQIKTYVWVCNEYLKEQKFDDVLRVAAQAEKHFSDKDLQKIKYFEAEALRAKGDCDGAGKFYVAVIAFPEKNVYTASSQIGEGLCMEKAGHDTKARALFQKVLDDYPDDYTLTAHARFEMANLAAAHGNLQEAFRLYLLVATIYDNDEFCSQSLWKAGRMAERLQHKDDAVKMYSEILDKYKSTPAAAKAKERLQSLR